MGFVFIQVCSASPDRSFSGMHVGARTPPVVVATATMLPLPLLLPLQAEGSVAKVVVPSATEKKKTTRYRDGKVVTTTGAKVR